MSSKTSKTSKRNPDPAPEFEHVRNVIKRYCVLEDAEADIATVWAIGTWCFSPMCQWPATFPLLYITGEAGSGKTVLGQDVLGMTARMWRSATGATGPTLFRMLGRVDTETGEIENYAPTLCIDEVDATFAGAKDEPMRQGLNVSYKRGATIPRASGKSTIDFPVYGPKVMMGIDNGHLPETVVQRSIRIEMRKRTQDELTAAQVQPFYTFDIDDEKAELQQELSNWAKANSMVLRDYRPNPPEGLTARQWEISRTMVQLAHALNIEQRMVDALITVFGRKRERSNARQRLYAAIQRAFQSNDTDRLASSQIMEQLAADGVQVPGNSKKGLAAVLSEEGIQPQHIRFRNDHPFVVNGGKNVQRGYMLYQFDYAFVDYLNDDDDEA